jgi:glucose/arabinose dehydrogenase
MVPGVEVSVTLRRCSTAILGGPLLALVLATGTAEAGAPAGVQAEAIASFDSPTYVAAAPGRPRYLYVTEKSGVIRVMRNGVTLAQPFLDISGRVMDSGEQGLLSIAFAPRFRKNRRFYVYFNSSSGCTGGCPILVEEFKARRRNPARARPGSRRRVISIPHPDASNHNGGTVSFGPDRRLWLAPGDGGGGGDQYQNARDPSSLLGKLLRITPVQRRPNRPGYRVPKSNPFVGRFGRDEIWSYGLRNPYRFSFDAGLDAVAIGDVGQTTQEEVDIVSLAKARGAGFGWPEFEGTFDYQESPPYTPPTPPLAPIFTYPNPSGSAAVTGGVIAHDPDLPQLEDRYLFADFYAGQIRSFVPNLATNQAVDVRNLDVAPIAGLVAFASGLDGQLYVLSLHGQLYKLEPE